MDNKYGLGSSKVAHAHHEITHRVMATPMTCHHCGSDQLTLCPSMNDHFCKECGEYQSDLPLGYFTGRSTNY